MKRAVNNFYLINVSNKKCACIKSCECGLSGKVGNYMTTATTSCKIPPKSHKF